jgi:hypothetical protein
VALLLSAGAVTRPLGVAVACLVGSGCGGGGGGGGADGRSLESFVVGFGWCFRLIVVVVLVGAREDESVDFGVCCWFWGCGKKSLSFVRVLAGCCCVVLWGVWVPEFQIEDGQSRIEYHKFR